MKLLQEKGYHSITLDDVYAWKQGKKKLDAKSVVITFDDGFYSTTKFAQPVLKRYGFTGSVFVIGSAIDEHHGPYKPSIRQHASHADMKDEQVLQYYSHSYNLHHKDKNGFRINQLSNKQRVKIPNRPLNRDRLLITPNRMESITNEYRRYYRSREHGWLLDIMKTGRQSAVMIPMHAALQCQRLYQIGCILGDDREQVRKKHRFFLHHCDTPMLGIGHLHIVD